MESIASTVDKVRKIMSDEISVKSVNWHLTTRCNYNCKFCFAQKLDTDIRDLKCAEEVLKKLKAVGIEKRLYFYFRTYGFSCSINCMLLQYDLNNSWFLIASTIQL